MSLHWLARRGQQQRYSEEGVVTPAVVRTPVFRHIPNGQISSISTFATDVTLYFSDYALIENQFTW
jgi:hypothetical protein